MGDGRLAPSAVMAIVSFVVGVTVSVTASPVAQYSICVNDFAFTTVFDVAIRLCANPFTEISQIAT